MMRLAVALLLLATSAAARAESGRWGSFELRLSTYRPNVDESGGNGAYRAVFGDGRTLMFRGLFSKSVYTGYGTVDVGLGAGYFQDEGKGVLPPEGVTQTDESTKFRIIPLSLAVTYRFDWVARRYWWMPLAPYTRVAYERYYWAIENGSGKTATFQGQKGSGSTSGYSYTFGIAFLLDAIDGQVAREAELDTGINDTYIFFDITKTAVDDFGDVRNSFDLSDKRWTPSIGLVFVF